ncbi:MAG TPA: hypothetical protein VMK53_01910 [Gemmatimonadales bacterium]|nr:hypothetical protein [Gemmatimonadales bacterium]
MTAPLPLPEAAPPAPPPRSTLGGMVVVGLVLAVALLALWPRYTPSARDPRLVAVMPFHLASEDSALAVLSEGMVDLFDARLNGEQGFRTVAPVAAIRAWREASGGRFDVRVSEPEALDIAERLEAAFLLLGTIMETGDRLEVQAALLAVPDGRVLGQFRSAGPADSLARIVNELVTRFVASRRAGGLEAGTQLPNTSPTAMYAWLDGRAAYRDGRFEDAAGAFGTALQADSTFPLAALWAAMTARRTEQPLPRLAADTLGLGPRDRALYRAVLPAPDVATEYLLWRAADSLSIRRPEPPLALAQLLVEFGGLLDPDSAAVRAYRHAERASLHDPRALAPLEMMVRAAAQLGDSAGLRRAAEAMTSADSAGEASVYAEWRQAHAFGNPAALAALRRRFVDLPSPVLLRILGGAQVDGIGLDDAEAAAAVLGRRGDASDPLVAARLYHYYRNRGRPEDAARYKGMAGIDPILESALFGSDLEAARSRVRILRSALPDSAPSAVGLRRAFHRQLCELAVWESAHGERAEAAALRARLAALEVTWTTAITPETHACEAMADALLAIREGRPLPDATRIILSAVHHRVVRDDALRVATQMLLAWGDEVTGDFDAAMARLPVLAGHESGPAWLADVLRERGRLAQRGGRREDAVRAYEHYLQLRSTPAPGLSEEVAAVRRALAELLAGG